MTGRPPPRPSLYDYSDYRGYLRDYYLAEKQRRPTTFSFRYFARRAGQTSPNFLKLVIDGKRNLGAKSILSFAHALNLDEDETAFFTELVHHGQAKTKEEGAHHLGRMTAIRNLRRAQKIEGPFIEYLAHWYLPAIRELVARPDFVENARWIGQALIPPVGARKVKQALATLLEFGLLRRGERGRLERSGPNWTTGPTNDSKVVSDFHHQMLVRAAEAIDSVPAENRSLSSLVVSASPTTLQIIRRILQNAQEEILAVCDGDPSPDGVYQVGLQMIPLSTSKK